MDCPSCCLESLSKISNRTPLFGVPVSHLFHPQTHEQNASIWILFSSSFYLWVFIASIAQLWKLLCSLTWILKLSVKSWIFRVLLHSCWRCKTPQLLCCLVELSPSFVSKLCTCHNILTKFCESLRGCSHVFGPTIAHNRPFIWTDKYIDSFCEVWCISCSWQHIWVHMDPQLQIRIAETLLFNFGCSSWQCEFVMHWHLILCAYVRSLDLDLCTLSPNLGRSFLSFSGHHLWQHQMAHWCLPRICTTGTTHCYPVYFRMLLYFLQGSLHHLRGCRYPEQWIGLHRSI